MSIGMTAEELRGFQRRYVEVANNRDYDRMDELTHDELIIDGTRPPGTTWSPRCAGTPMRCRTWPGRSRTS